jgi:hypothetical protein
MANLAAYYATQKVSKGVAVQGANLALGEKIYRGGKKEKFIHKVFLFYKKISQYYT